MNEIALIGAQEVFDEAEDAVAATRGLVRSVLENNKMTDEGRRRYAEAEEAMNRFLRTARNTLGR